MRNLRKRKQNLTKTNKQKQNNSNKTNQTTTTKNSKTVKTTLYLFMLKQRNFEYDFVWPSVPVFMEITLNLGWRIFVAMQKSTGY